MNKETMKLIGVALGTFIVTTSAVIAAQAIYTHTKLGVDKKPLIIASVIGVGTVFVLLKYK